MTYRQAQTIVARVIQANDGHSGTTDKVALLSAISDGSATDSDSTTFDTCQLQDFFGPGIPASQIASDLNRDANPPVVRPPNALSGETFIANLSLYVITGGRHGA